MILNMSGKIAPPLPRNGLIAEYLFNSNLNDTSGNNKNWTNNGITFGTGVGGIATSAVFSGSAYGQISDNFNAFKSVSFWVKRNNTNSMTPFAFGALRSNNDPSGFDVMFQSPGTSAQLGFRGYPGKYPAQASVSIPYDNSWHHVVVNTNGYGSSFSQISFYYDGVQKTITQINSGGSNPTTIYQVSKLGAYFDTNWASRIFMNGQIAALRIYDRVLTANEMAALYQEGK